MIWHTAFLNSCRGWFFPLKIQKRKRNFQIFGLVESFGIFIAFGQISDVFTWQMSWGESRVEVEDEGVYLL